jgi:hypothetical protein
MLNVSAKIVGEFLNAVQISLYQTDPVMKSVLQEKIKILVLLFM